jgi:hypothetical protein
MTLKQDVVVGSVVRFPLTKTQVIVTRFGLIPL